MVTGVFSIPLHASTPGTERHDSGQRVVLREYIASGENSLALVAAEQMLTGRLQFNPLVLVGPVGVGKSLLAANLAQQWRRKHPELNVVTLAAADFARSYASSLRLDSLSEWNQRFSKAGLLAIDDLDKLDGKTAAQHQLIHILDRLVERHAPAIITASRHPTRLNCLAPSLASRLSAGLVVPLVPPGPDARRIIVSRLAAQFGIELSERVTDMLSRSPGGSLNTVPQIRHAILQLLNLSQVENRLIDAETTYKLLQRHSASGRPALPTIAKLVSRYFKVRITDLKGPSRFRQVVHARSIAMYLARQLTDSSLQQIGRYFGNRDHTTVLHACRKAVLGANDPATRQALAELTEQLASIPVTLGSEEVADEAKNEACEKDVRSQFATLSKNTAN